MGSEDLHHRRKKRKIESLKRREAFREPYDIVLIVCEGEKTECNYLKDLCSELNLSSVNVKIYGFGCDPLTLFKYACSIYKDQDRVFCIFDRDEHKNYQDSLNSIKNRPKFSAITSVPCFEFFLLLHYTYSTRAYRKIGKKSAGEKLLSELKKYIPNYCKGHPDIYKITKLKLPTAIQNAEKIEKEKVINGDNPSTQFHQLVKYLQNLKR